MKKEHKQIIALIGGLGLLGSVSYFTLGASLASLTVGGYGVLFFLTTYATIMANVFVGMTIIDIVKSIYREQFVKKMPIKFGGAYQIYKKVAELEKDLNDRLNKQDTLTPSAKVINYKTIKKLQKTIRNELAQLSALPEKETKAFNKFYSYNNVINRAKNVLESLNYHDAEIEEQMATASELQTNKLEEIATNSTSKPEKIISKNTVEVAKIVTKNRANQAKNTQTQVAQSVESDSRAPNEVSETELIYTDDRQL